VSVKAKEIDAVALERAGWADVGRVLFVGNNLQNDVLKPQELGMQVLYFDRSGDRPMPKQILSDGMEAIQSWDVFRP